MMFQPCAFLKDWRVSVTKRGWPYLLVHFLDDRSIQDSFPQDISQDANQHPNGMPVLQTAALLPRLCVIRGLSHSRFVNKHQRLVTSPLIYFSLNLGFLCLCYWDHFHLRLAFTQAVDWHFLPSVATQHCFTESSLHFAFVRSEFMLYCHLFLRFTVLLFSTSIVCFSETSNML